MINLKIKYVFLYLVSLLFIESTKDLVLFKDTKYTNKYFLPWTFLAFLLNDKDTSFLNLRNIGKIILLY